MTQNLVGPSGFDLPAAFARFVSVFARLMIGMMLVLVAGVVALMTAFAGLMLAAAALVMRYTVNRRMQPAPASGEASQITLEARPTPRGWTVE